MRQALRYLRNCGLGALAAVCLALGILLLTSGVCSAEPDSTPTTPTDSTAPADVTVESGVDSPLGGPDSKKDKITLRMDDVQLSFGEIEVGTTVTCPTAINLQVKCNGDWDLLYVASGFSAADGLPISQLRWGSRPDGADSVPFAAAGAFLTDQPRTHGQGLSITHYYTMEMPLDVAIREYTATIIYIAVAH